MIRNMTEFLCGFPGRRLAGRGGWSGDAESRCPRPSRKSRVAVVFLLGACRAQRARLRSEAFNSSPVPAKSSDFAGGEIGGVILFDRPPVRLDAQPPAFLAGSPPLAPANSGDEVVGHVAQRLFAAVRRQVRADGPSPIRLGVRSQPDFPTGAQRKRRTTAYGGPLRPASNDAQSRIVNEGLSEQWVDMFRSNCRASNLFPAGGLATGSQFSRTVCT